MKRTTYISAVILLVLVLPAFAQIRGVPPSVTSMGPGRGRNPGPAASVTSLGPRGFAPRGAGPNHFSSGSSFRDGRHRGSNNLRNGRRHRNDAVGFYPYVPYGYTYDPYGYVDGNGYQDQAPADSESDQVAEPDPGVPTAASAPPDNSQQPAAGEQRPADTTPQIPVMLVYRDGHEQDVMNYAIVGSTLYDMDASMTHKIPLAELDLKATVKANDDRGIEFSLPTSANMEYSAGKQASGSVW